MTDRVTPDSQRHPPRRRLRLLCTLLFVLISGALAFWLYLHRDRVTESTYGLIREGMTLQEIEAVFGRGPDLVEDLHITGPPGSPTTVLRRGSQQWKSADLTVVVLCDEEGNVFYRGKSGPLPAPWYTRLWHTAKRSVGLQ
jgi:hypothetical protein